jgi:hypothetical protein
MIIGHKQYFFHQKHETPLMVEHRFFGIYDFFSGDTDWKLVIRIEHV